MQLLSPFPRAEKLKSTSPPGQDITDSPGQCILCAQGGWLGRCPSLSMWEFLKCLSVPPGFTPRGSEAPLPSSPVLQCVPMAPSLPQTSSASPCSRQRKPRSGSRAGASRSRSPSECPAQRAPALLLVGGWDTVGVLSHLCPFPPHSFYKANHVQRFSYSRPFKRGPNDPDNEFAVSTGRSWQDPQLGGTGELEGPCKVSRGETGDPQSWDGGGGGPVPTEVGAPMPWGSQGMGEGRGVTAALPTEHVD